MNQEAEFKNYWNATKKSVDQLPVATSGNVQQTKEVATMRALLSIALNFWNDRLALEVSRCGVCFIPLKYNFLL